MWTSPSRTSYGPSLDALLHEATYRPPHPDPVRLVRAAVRRSARRRRLVGVVAAVAVLAVGVPSVAALVVRDPDQQLLPPAASPAFPVPTNGDCGTYVLGLVDQTIPKNADECFTHNFPEPSFRDTRIAYTRPLPDGRWSLVSLVLSLSGVEVTTTIPAAPGETARRTQERCQGVNRLVTVVLPDLPDLSDGRALVPSGGVCRPAVDVPVSQTELDLLPKPAGSARDLVADCGPTDVPAVSGRVDAPGKRVAEVVLLRPDGRVAGQTSNVGPDGRFLVELPVGQLNVAAVNLADTWVEARDASGTLLLSQQLPFPLPRPFGGCG